MANKYHNNNYHNMLWGRWENQTGREHPAHKLLREQARAEGWVGVHGFAEFVAEQYKGRLYMSKVGEITGIGFRNEEDCTLFALSIEST